MTAMRKILLTLLLTANILTFPLDRQCKKHKLTLGIIDPGQMVQRITFATIP